MSKKHTPGPWQSTAGTIVDQHNMVVFTSWRSINDDGDWIIPKFDGPNQIDAQQAQANRDLMALSPELLAIVKRMEVAIGNYCCANGITHDDMEDDDEGKELLDACNAADELLKRLS
jgi:hypothetical protein